MAGNEEAHRLQAQAYHSPKWESAPSFSTFLEVFEDNKMVATIRLDSRSHFLVGRNAHDCDIVFDPHSKVSRTHAAIVHHLTGELYLIDLKSAHHTFLDGDQVPPNKPMKLVDGAILEFAQDTGLNFTVRVLAATIPGSKQPSGTLTLRSGEPVLVSALGRDKPGGGDGGPRDMGAETRNGDAGSGSPREGEPAAKRPRHGSDVRGYAKGQRPAPSSAKFVVCKHLLLKHVGSRHPTTHRVTDKKAAEEGKWEVTRSKEEAITEMDGYRAELQSMIDDGEPSGAVEERFSQLAAAMSDCKNSSLRGGDLGKFGRGKMHPVFEEAAFALPVGEISPIVDSPSGVHVILRTG